MEENGINEDQIESIIQDFAAYCLQHSTSYDTVIQSGREALYLEEKYRVPIEKIPEYIIQAKKTIDNLEDERQEILRQKQQALEDRDTIRQQLDEMRQQRDAIVAEIQKYGKETSSIKRIKKLEIELDDTKKLIEQYERSILRLTKELNDARLEAAKFEGYLIETDAKRKDYERRLSINLNRLSICLNELDKQEKKNVALRQCLQILFILIISLTMELSLITKYKRSLS